MADKAVLDSLRAQISVLESSYVQSVNDVNQKSRETDFYVDDQLNSRIQDGVSGDGQRSSEALKKIIALVNASDKSERAIRDRLSRSDFNQNDIERAVEDAKRYGFIDDARFSEVLIRSRISQCKGSAGIVRELAENGIEATDVKGWPYEFPISYEEELNRALSLLERKPPRSKNQREGAYRRLIQKGYPSGVASTAARMWSER